MNAAVEKIIKDSLDTGLLTDCPKCGASWKCLEDSLLEGPGPNYDIARIIIDSCDFCSMRFKEENVKCVNL